MGLAKVPHNKRAALKDNHDYRESDYSAWGWCMSAEAERTLPAALVIGITDRLKAGL